MTGNDLLKQLQTLTPDQRDLPVMVGSVGHELFDATRVYASVGPKMAIVITRTPSIEGIDFEDDLREAEQQMGMHVVVIRTGGPHTRVRVVGPFHTGEAADEWVDLHASKSDVAAIYTGVLLTAPEYVDQGHNAEIAGR